MKTRSTPHDLMPMFTVTNRWDGAIVRYQEVWQRQNLLLASTPPADPATAPYLEAVRARSGELGDDVQVVVTSDGVDGIPSPGVDWLHYIQMECPECEGERR